MAQGIPRDQVFTKPPPAVVVRIGEKAPDGSPIRKNVFRIVESRSDASGTKPFHPDFAAFNNPSHADFARWGSDGKPWDATCPECGGKGQVVNQYNKLGRCKLCEGAGYLLHEDFIRSRSSIRGYLVYSDWGESYDDRFQAWKLPGITPPRGQAACVGIGGKAKRWINGKYEDIPCPGIHCEFQKVKVGEKGFLVQCACKPLIRFNFLLRWPEGSKLPVRPARFVTASKHNLGAFDAFHKQIVDYARAVGIQNPDLTGYPFVMRLNIGKGEVMAEGQNKGQAVQFPSIDIQSECNPTEFFAQQAQRRRALLETYEQDRLTAAPIRALLPGVTEDAEDYEVISTSLVSPRGES